MKGIYSFKKKQQMSAISFKFRSSAGHAISCQGSMPLMAAVGAAPKSSKPRLAMPYSNGEPPFGSQTFNIIAHHIISYNIISYHIISIYNINVGSLGHQKSQLSNLSTVCPSANAPLTKLWPAKGKQHPHKRLRIAQTA